MGFWYFPLESMHLLYQKTAKNAVAIRFVNYSVDITYNSIITKRRGLTGFVQREAVQDGREPRFPDMGYHWGALNKWMLGKVGCYVNCNIC